jgi:hypothetical protein
MPLPIRWSQAQAWQRGEGNSAQLVEDRARLQQGRFCKKSPREKDG